MGLNNKNNKKAFTLAEAMIALLVLSLITMAYLPIMTKRTRLGGGSEGSLWVEQPAGVSHAATDKDIYSTRSNGSTAGVIIGASSFVSGDPTSRLLINTAVKGHNHMLFRQTGTADPTGRLVVDGFQNVGLGDVTFDYLEPDSNGQTGIGAQAKMGADYTTAVGYKALAGPGDSVAIGSSSTTESSGAVAVGLSSNAIGTDSIAIGDSAKTNAVYSTALGANANASGTYSIAIGGADSAANAPNATMTNAIAIGYKAQATALSGVAIGNQASAKGLHDTALGAYALNAGGSGGDNTAVGFSALKNTTTGTYNTAVGVSALFSNISGSENTAVGFQALTASQTASYNTAIGNNACSSIVSATGNTCVGHMASLLTTGVNNTSVGYKALSANITGTDNTAVGYQACLSTTGSNNVCLGSLSNTSAGVSNGTAIGYGATVTGTNGVAIGNGSSAGADQIVLGKTTVTIPGVQIPGSLIIGTGAVVNVVNVAGIWKTSSDRRLKNVGGEFTAGLDKIRELKVYNFTFKKDKNKTPRVGVIAQDLQKVFPSAVVKDKNGYFMIRQDDMFYAMVNSIKQLDKIVKNLVEGFKTVIAKIQSVDDKIVAISKVNQIHFKQLKELKSDTEEMKVRLAKLEKR